MTHSAHTLCGLALAGLTLTTSPASAGEPEPQRCGAIRVGFELDPAFVGAPLLELATSVSVRGTTGTFVLTFDGQTTAPSHVDGRLLTAHDLSDEQGYRMQASWAFAAAYTYELYRGGVRVAVADVEDGVAPFVLEGVHADDFVHTVEARADGHGGKHIEIESWTFGTWNATFDDGDAVLVDRVVVRAHEVGHLLGLSHEVGGTTVDAIGASALRVEPTTATYGYIRIKKLNSGG